jgi:hypothetical protein
MNCRVKTLYLTLVRLSLMLFLAQSSFAQESAYVDISDTPQLSVYPKWLYNRMRDTRGWEPSLVATQECKLSFSSPELTPEKCEAHYDLSSWESFLSKLYVSFDFSDTKQFQRIQFEPEPGLKIRGLLALQPDKSQKKPLVILRMGIHGNIDEILAERFLARLVHADLKYNLLLLESLTSHGFLTLNKDVTVGGIEEGLHTFYILNLITHKQVSWADEISDIYLMGISLAGPGVFVANYLDENSLVKGKIKKPDVKAIELFCPLVNFEETFAEHKKSGWFSGLADIWNRTRLVSLRLKNKQFEEIPWWRTFFDLKPRFLPQVLQELNETHGKPLLKPATIEKRFPDLKLPKEFHVHVEKSKTLYELNHFWKLYKSELTPIQIYLTPNDPAVMNNINAELIRQKKQPGSFGKIRFTDVKGIHCALAPEYQWPFLVELVRRGFENR